MRFNVKNFLKVLCIYGAKAHLKTNNITYLSFYFFNKFFSFLEPQNTHRLLSLINFKLHLVQKQILKLK